jgi:dipeptidyl aminopeptidase/acylaminoacyl peptidase
VGGFSKVKLTNGNLDFSAVDANPRSVTTDDLFIVDITTRLVSQLTRGEDGYFTPAWSPDGRKILCVSNEGHSFGGGQSSTTNLLIIDIATGAKSPLTSGLGYRRIPSWSPDGKSISFFGASTEHPNQEYVFVVPSSGGEPRNLSLALDRRLFFAYWSPDSQSMVINYKDGADLPIARLRVADGTIEMISDREAAGRFLLASSNSGALAWSQSDPSGPAIIHYLPFGKRSSYEVADLNPQVRNWETGAQEVVRWRNASGDDMEGVLIKPVGYRAGHRYPLIVDAYPKLGNSFKGDPMWGNQALAARGYAVFFPDGDGPHVWETPWRSMLHATRSEGPAGVEIAVDDVVSGVDTLIDRGIVDPGRLCLYGFSNGGAVVDQVITKSPPMRDFGGGSGRRRLVVCVFSAHPEQVHRRPRGNIPLGKFSVIHTAISHLPAEQCYDAAASGRWRR